MSLTWDARNIKNFEALNPDTTRTMVFQCAIIGFGEITDKNADDFYLRTKMMDYAHGGDSGITLATVLAYRGLRTNAFPDRTDAAFRKQLAGTMRDRAARALHEEKVNA